jgi:hypothetical protein
MIPKSMPLDLIRGGNRFFGKDHAQNEIRMRRPAVTPASLNPRDFLFSFCADRGRARGDDYQTARSRFVVRIIPTCGRNGGLPSETRKSVRAIRASVRTGCWVHIPDHRQTLFNRCPVTTASRWCRSSAGSWLDATSRASHAAPDASCRTSHASGWRRASPSSCAAWHA